MRTIACAGAAALCGLAILLLATAERSPRSPTPVASSPESVQLDGANRDVVVEGVPFVQSFLVLIDDSGD